MDKLSLYRQLIQDLLVKWAKLSFSKDPIERQTIFDRLGDHYQIVQVSWNNGSPHIYGCVLHIDIKNEKIWVQHNGTKDAIVDQLLAQGVPQQDIVLAAHASHSR